MDPSKLFYDKRFGDGCIYCGGPPDSREHAPSKILLDDPLPSDLETVDACKSCNRSYSLDEEYVACIIECARCGSTDPDRIERPKVANSLRHNPLLAEKIAASSVRGDDGVLYWLPEPQRLRRVLVKLARSHVACELNRAERADPILVHCVPLRELGPEDRRAFEATADPASAPWAEVGTRAFMRLMVVQPGNILIDGGWIEVQPDRYRYIVEEGGETVEVRMVLSECLAAWVRWKTNFEVEKEEAASGKEADDNRG